MAVVTRTNGELPAACTCIGDVGEVSSESDLESGTRRSTRQSGRASFVVANRRSTLEPRRQHRRSTTVTAASGARRRSSQLRKVDVGGVPLNIIDKTNKGMIYDMIRYVSLTRVQKSTEHKTGLDWTGSSSLLRL